jgi:hypothetical protein
MSSFRNYLKGTMRAVAFVTLASTLPAAAETVEVAPGVQVTKRTYAAPVNEQPFFGFAAKTAEQKAEDEKFVSAMIGATGSREKAFEETTKRAWIAIQAGKVREAAVRFNQAFPARYERPRFGSIKPFSFHLNRAAPIMGLR